MRPSAASARILLLTGVLLAAGWSALVWRPSGLRLSAQNGFYDLMLDRVALRQAPPGVAVVDVDDDSLAALGQWPWPRYRTAALLDAVAQSAPRAIALDMLFAEPDRSSLDVLEQEFRRSFGVPLTFGGVPAGLRDNDGYFAAVVGGLPVAGAGLLLPGDGAPQPAVPAGWLDGGEQLTPATAGGWLGNLPALAAAQSAAGFINFGVEGDGVLRRLPLIARTPAGDVPSLALAALMVAEDVRTARVTRDWRGPTLHVGRHRIAIDDSAQAWLRFAGPAATLETVPAHALLSGEASLPPGRIVVVGTSGAGLDQVGVMPLGSHYPGGEAVATLIDNLLADNAIRRLSWEPAWRSASAALLLVLATLLFARAPLRWLLPCLLLVPPLLYSASAALFVHGGMFLPLSPQMLGLVVLSLVLGVLRYGLLHRKHLRWAQELACAQQRVLQALATLGETRDSETGGHVARTQHYVRALALELRRRGAAGMDDPLLCERLFHAAPLHDIGKVGIPDAILLKPGRLTPEEWATMQTHAALGQRVLAQAASGLPGEGSFVALAAEMAGSHHEKWDGSGYPLGLSGLQIPLSGRLMALADVYDALTTRRCYKPAFSHADARAQILAGRGSHFDPSLVDAFVAVEDEFQQIACRFADEPPPANTGQAGATSGF